MFKKSTSNTSRKRTLRPSRKSQFPMFKRRLRSPKKGTNSAEFDRIHKEKLISKMPLQQKRGKKVIGPWFRLQLQNFKSHLDQKRTSHTRFEQTDNVQNHPKTRANSTFCQQHRARCNHQTTLTKAKCIITLATSVVNPL